MLSFFPLNESTRVLSAMSYERKVKGMNMLKSGMSCRIVEAVLIGFGLNATDAAKASPTAESNRIISDTVLFAVQ